MSSNTFDKNKLDVILGELAKEYKKLVGKKTHAEIILIGGAAIIENYKFRQMTMDVDATILAPSALKDAINTIRDKFCLPHGWLNDDFIQTSSYSRKIPEISEYYKTFNDLLEVRTVSAEYLIAMKLKAGRKYKNDLSDVVGILLEHKASKKEITKDQIKCAIKKLYENENNIPNDSREFLEALFDSQDYEKFYKEIQENEKAAKEVLIDFDKKHPNTLKTENIDIILDALKAKNS